MAFAELADVIVVGAGPAGSAAAHYLGQYGLSVIVLEKGEFPRDKVCGDGLTPRAVSELLRMAFPIPESEGWVRNYGLRAYGGGHAIEVPWPELASQPNYGSAAPRMEFDQKLIQHALKQGTVELHEGVTVTRPLFDERTGRVIGVYAKKNGAGQSREEFAVRARVVLDAGGVSARIATAAGREKNLKRPMGVAIRTYFESPLANTDMMESHLELWAGKPRESELLPGYGWVFAVGNGLVNVGLGTLSSTAKPTGVDYKKVFQTWLENVPEEWGLTPDKQRGTVRSAALPMAFNRKPHYKDGLALIGDAGGMVSPFNGEGIAYALASGRIVADHIAQALGRQNEAQFDRVMAEYPKELRDELGGYYTLGRVFAALIERPEVMNICVKYGLPRPTLMRFTMKLLSDTYDRRDGDWMDKVITTLTKIVPKA
ncbi:MAG: geranylgeranyl reductase family protein [Arcanobacterium sp.]|nr:geranylgeranyl reductase family protein [Arcanobacterium sp.]